MNKSHIDRIETFCLKDSLKSYDLYDIWKTPIGTKVKSLYNFNKYLGIAPAGLLTLLDLVFNNFMRLFYKKQEYPIVRALAAQTLMNLYSATRDAKYLSFSKKHIDYLIQNHSTGYSGICWGIGFKWPAGKGIIYDANTPFSTHTPYVLEAIHNYIVQSGDKTYITHIESIYNYFENDVKIMSEDENSIGISYGPFKDRLITNAVSYALYAYCIFSIYIKKDEEKIQKRINKLYNFVQQNQLEQGEWLYEPFNSDSFIDCFHSCFILKNIYKANKISPLSGSEEILNQGYTYIKCNFYNGETNLVKRFSKSNKPSIVKYDLYDNAEFLNLTILLGEEKLAEKLQNSIVKNFQRNENIYSVIDFLSIRRYKNTSRWAVMPYLYALSNFKH